MFRRNKKGINKHTAVKATSFNSEILESRLLFGAHPLTDASGNSSTIQATFNGVSYFIASGSNGNGSLWRTDGTAHGTWMVKDIDPVHAGNGILKLNEPFLYVFKGMIYFGADDGSGHGVELWRSDGTALGTRLFDDIVPGGKGSFPTLFTQFNGELYFTILNGANVPELWSTDGTVAETQQVTSFNGGGLYAAIGKLFYRSTDVSLNGGQGNALWVTDGTSAGTKELFLGNVDGDSSKFAVAGNDLYFVTVDGTTYSLNRTDGTVAGSMSLMPLLPAGSSLGQIMGTFNNKVYFTLDSGQGLRPWFTDGTVAGTGMLANLRMDANASMVVLNNHIYFAAPGSNNVGGLWMSDGTPAGTSLAVSGSVAIDTQTPMVVNNDRIYFTGATGITGTEPYSTDGTIAGTRLVEDIDFGTLSSLPKNWTVSNGVVFFTCTQAMATNLFQLYTVESPAAIEDGTLQIAGDDSNNTIHLGVAANTLTVTVDGQTSTFATANVKRIDIEGYGGEDAILLDDAVPNIATTVNGGDGNDTIDVAGNDNTLSAISAAMFIGGGAGQDELIFNDSAHSGNQNYYVGPGSFNSATSATFLFSSIEQATVNNASGNVYVNPSALTTFFVTGRTNLYFDTSGTQYLSSVFTTNGSSYSFLDRQPVIYAPGPTNFVTYDAAASTGSNFNYNAPAPTLTFNFDTAFATLTAGALLLLNIDTGALVSVPQPVYDNMANTITFTFDPSALPDGNYEAILRAGAATGNSPTTISAVSSFFSLRGDANHDGTVDITDLGIFASNWQKAGATFSQGDFNYDGKVDVTDLGIMTSNWQKQLHPWNLFQPDPPQTPATMATGVITSIPDPILTPTRRAASRPISILE